MVLHKLRMQNVAAPGMQASTEQSHLPPHARLHMQASWHETLYRGFQHSCTWTQALLACPAHGC
jgi:hypothetical protein